MTDKEKIRKNLTENDIALIVDRCFHAYSSSHRIEGVNMALDIFHKLPESRDPEVKELEERIKIHIGVISDCEGLSGAQQKKIDGLSNQNKLLRDALENVKAIQPLYWNMTSDNMHPEHKFALSMAGIKEACKIAQEALNKTGGNDDK